MIPATHPVGGHDVPAIIVFVHALYGAAQSGDEGADRQLAGPVDLALRSVGYLPDGEDETIVDPDGVRWALDDDHPYPLVDVEPDVHPLIEACRDPGLAMQEPVEEDPS